MEFLMLQQMMGKGTADSISVALLVLLTLACLFRPQRIYSKPMFRAAAICLACAVVIPSIQQIVMQLSAGNSSRPVPSMVTSRRNNTQKDMALRMTTLGAVQPGLLAAGILCAVMSLMPPRGSQGTQVQLASQPPQPRSAHPQQVPTAQPVATPPQATDPRQVVQPRKSPPPNPPNRR